MRYEYFVSKRYLLSPRSDKSVSMITWISIFGVALGVIALIVSTSVMNGFRTNLRNAVTGSLPHITLFSFDDDLEVYGKLKESVLEHPEVLGASPYVYKQALISGRKKPKGALLRGIDPNQESNVTRINSYLRESIYGQTQLTKEQQAKVSETIFKRLNHPLSREQGMPDGIILGASLAQHLSAKVGDKVKVISSEQRMTPIGDIPLIKKLEVIGIFESGISGYDEVLAFADYRLVQKIYRMGDKVSGLGVKIRDPENASEIAKELADLNSNFMSSNWADENKSLFQVMKLEKIGLFLILTLIIVVAAFNIISSLIMLVSEKSREITILKALGATDGSVKCIFIIQGVVIGLVGTLAGVFLGLGLCWLLANFNIVEIPPGVYPGGNRIPILVDWSDVGLTTFCSFIICVIVTLYPSNKAAKMNPVDPLRYE